MSKVNIWVYGSENNGEVSIHIGKENLAIARWLSTEFEDMAKTTDDKAEKIDWLRASCELDMAIANAEKFTGEEKPETLLYGVRFGELTRLEGDE